MSERTIIPEKTGAFFHNFSLFCVVKKGGKRLFFFVLMGYKREKLEEISSKIPPFYAVFEALEGWGETESVFLHKKDGHFLLVVNKNRIWTLFAVVVEWEWRRSAEKYAYLIVNIL